jgi:hypothetical protein
MSSNTQITDSGNANIDRPNLSTDLVSHIMTIVRGNREIRDRKYKKQWDAFERTFRGIYTGADKTREGERSKLVSPALSAAIESTAATIEDAIFSRDQWFDTMDNIGDDESGDMTQAHKMLKEDLDIAGCPDAIAKIVLNGCLYGTGIGKVNVTRREIRSFAKDGVKKEFRPLVTLEPIPPWEFVIDSQARDVASAYFCAHETHVPRHKVYAKIKSGAYKKVNIMGNTTTAVAAPAGQETPDGQRKTEDADGSVFITEYYGLVPAAALKGHVQWKPEDVQGNGSVEVIATVANERELLRVVINPFALKDRPIIAYQHSVVPGQFWGRGVAEKGWNAQRALDAELRARMDALGLLTSPMMGADITRLPRNPDMRVRPGKVWLTRGRPSEVLEPVILGNIDPNTFNQSSEMERLVQVGTGSIESNAPINNDRRNETASGISMIQSSALKRMRRTMWNMERQFLNPFIKKAYHRYMQFNPTRYPNDVEFVIKGTMGIVAREFEQSNLTALLSVVSPDHPNYQLILRGVIELSGSPKRDELLAQMDEQSKPDPEKEAMEKRQREIQMESAEATLAEQKLENMKTQKEIEKLDAEIAKIVKDTQLADEQMDINAANVANQATKNKLMARADETNRIKIASESKWRANSANKPQGK